MLVGRGPTGATASPTSCTGRRLRRVDADQAHDAPEDFLELRQLEDSGFTDDPADWSTLPTSNSQRRDASAPASSRAA
jgi:hypothetical protein